MEIEIRFGYECINFDHRSAASEKKGEALVAAAHVLNVIERKVGDSSFLQGSVVRQTSVSAPPYSVEIEINGERNVVLDSGVIFTRGKTMTRGSCNGEELFETYGYESAVR
ncbi:hypothetical protein MTP99_007376 [Tenebrio molitor]|nr:hypothetical protein MTP99_007376 [Tenebrio molitor]